MSDDNNTRTCNGCGEQTTQPTGDCDSCTGEVRSFCINCGREGLIGIRSREEMWITPRHKTSEGVWCFAGRWPARMLGLRN